MFPFHPPTGEKHDAATGWAALDWLVRTCAPAYLSAAGLDAEADKLRSLPPVIDADAVRSASATLQPILGPAYRVSGVTRWNEVDARFRPHGAYSAKNTAFAAVGYQHGHPLAGVTTGVSFSAWSVAAYTAHALTNEQARQVAEALRPSVPTGVTA